MSPRNDRTLVLGPALRHVGPTTATIWVQTREPCTVEVLGHRAPTFEVHGHHYALVTVRDLEPGRTRTYEVHLDGQRAWPDERAGTPPSRIRTRPAPGTEDETTRLRVVFGSCRYPPTDDAVLERRLGIDALDAYATRLMGEVAAHEAENDAEGAAAALPDVLALLGDQVYADELTPRTQRWVSERRAAGVDGPPDEIADYEEYAHLYEETWTDRELRWLLSTVSTAMIFDDHDVRDDWNTSVAWREEMARQPWWAQRVRAGIASYWVYQHLGNMAPDEREADGLYRAVLAADGDVHDMLAEFGGRADADVGHPIGVRWSYRWDLGRTRLLMVDTRGGRVLTPDERSMINTPSFTWLEANALPEDGEPVDHLLLGSSIPWLMPPAVSHVQSVDEYAAARGSRLAELIRQEIDLEHWPAFRSSFDRLAMMIRRVASSSAAPRTVCVLSGDVHHSYVAQARFAEPTHSRVFQLTCSPVRNGIPWFMEYVFAAGWWRSLERVTLAASRWCGLTDPTVRWSSIGGPWFGNAVSTLEIRGPSAAMTVERSGRRGGLAPVARLPLST